MPIWSLPGLKQVRQSATLNTYLRLGHGQYWGHFPSHASATSFLKDSRKATYDDDDIVQINLDKFKDTHLFDWPVMFFLERTIQENNVKVVTDFGGHVGVKYHAYRNVIDFPADLSWQVVDLPAICREGRRRSSEDDAALSYHEDLGRAPACDLLLCSGSIQYSENQFDEIVEEIPEKPKHVIINKISVSDENFHTLEAFGNRRMPHRVMTTKHLDGIREKLGYAKIAEWEIPHRMFTVFHQKGKKAVEVIGQAWTKLALFLMWWRDVPFVEWA